jgi:hypothetical protein
MRALILTCVLALVACETEDVTLVPPDEATSVYDLLSPCVCRVRCTTDAVCNALGLPECDVTSNVCIDVSLTACASGTDCPPSPWFCADIQSGLACDFNRD